LPRAFRSSDESCQCERETLRARSHQCQAVWPSQWKETRCPAHSHTAMRAVLPLRAHQPFCRSLPAHSPASRGPFPKVAWRAPNARSLLRGHHAHSDTATSSPQTADALQSSREPVWSIEQESRLVKTSRQDIQQRVHDSTNRVQLPRKDCELASPLYNSCADAHYVRHLPDGRYRRSTTVVCRCVDRDGA